MRKILFMKRIALIINFLCGFLISAQIPQGVSYQAIALNPQGYPVGNTLIGVRLSILENSITGNTIYTETHTTTTNDRGLYNLVIGQGTPVSGLFPLIDWGTNTKFLKVELDVLGGTNYILSGTTQLWSVPYALYSEKANSVDAQNVEGRLSNSSTAGFMTNNKAYYLANALNNNNWIEQPLEGQPIDIVSCSFSLGVLTSTHAYVATIDNNQVDTATWFPIQLSGTPIKLSTSDGTIAVLTSTHAYVFTFTADSNNNITYNWFSHPISGTPRDIYGYGRSIFCIVTDTNAYAFGSTISNSSPEITVDWYTTPINGSIKEIRYNSNVFTIYTETHAHAFVPNYTLGGNLSFEWKSVQMSGNYIDSSK